MNLFPSIVSSNAILNGKPCIAGTRISVELILEWLGTGASVDSIAQKHPLLTTHAVLQAIQYAAHFSKNEIVIEVKPVA